MRDATEERLATQLRALGDTVDDELPPPVDLELQVVRRRRRARATRRWSGLAVAAVVMTAVVTVSVVHGTTGGRGRLHVATSPTTARMPRDSLLPGTVMLSSRELRVISLDTAGHQNATMVKAVRGDIKYARATEDHRELWYLSLKKGLRACGDVVRADIASGHSSTIVTHAVAFDVSPDGSRLALYGAGDLAHDRCVPVKQPEQGRVVVVDLTTATSSSVALGDVTTMRFSPDGSYLAALSCPGGVCTTVSRIDVPTALGAPLTVAPIPDGAASTAGSLRVARIEFGPDGLYVLRGLAPGGGAFNAFSRIDRIDARTGAVAGTLFTSSAFDVRQVAPTAGALYVIAEPTQPKARKFGLYRVESGKLVLVRSLDAPGILTPVVPLAGAG